MRKLKALEDYASSLQGAIEFNADSYIHWTKEEMRFRTKKEQWQEGYCAGRAQEALSNLTLLVGKHNLSQYISDSYEDT